MSIEQNIFNRLTTNMNESTQYNNNNGQVAADLAKGMGNCSFEYDGVLISSNGVISRCRIKVDINEDDLEVVESNNVVYVYLRADKIDYEILNKDTVLEVLGVVNADQVLNSIVRFQKITPKCWRDDQKLYLLKMNRNSGLIGRFEQSTGTFKNQEINYKSSNDEKIGQDMLTKDYLQQYFSTELSRLFCQVDPMTPNLAKVKFHNEEEHKFYMRKV